MVTITAANMLAYTNTSSGDCSAINTEALADILIDYINLRADTTINTFRAVAFPYTGLLSLTLTTSEYPVVMAGMNLMHKAFTDKGPDANISGLSITTILNDPQYAVYSEMLKLGIEKLRAHTGVAFCVGEDESGIDD